MCKKYTTVYNNKKIKCVDFSSFTDQLNFIDKFVLEDPFGIVEYVSQYDDFLGKHTFDESINGMTYGFKENTKYLIKTLSTMKAKKNTDEGIYLDNNGFAYDMGSVVNGEPECCLNMGLPQPKPCIRIMVDIVFSCSISAEKIYNRSIAITNLIHTLLLNGCIVELYMLDYNVQSDMDTLYTTKVDVDVLPIDSIAFACSPEYFRKIGWVTVDCIRQKESELGRGKSEVTDFLAKKIKDEKWFFIGGDYTLNDIRYNLHNSEDAINYISKMFKTFCEENSVYIDFEV